ncbi:hypothetical protein HYFRA_00011829 [Hymenoscyphus fraxineus]|uniref:Uncharacterized protein n=1 Tax=Hymenoscyphus fraxineus TaxID=746836 RepID=A0A9N9L5E0_9HELO|nr:hypothetical protein HYFRA_00011829 [Hymenoscyphus fraxineus]
MRFDVELFAHFPVECDVPNPGDTLDVTGKICFWRFVVHGVLAVVEATHAVRIPYNNTLNCRSQINCNGWVLEDSRGTLETPRSFHKQ